MIRPSEGTTPAYCPRCPSGQKQPFGKGIPADCHSRSLRYATNIQYLASDFCSFRELIPLLPCFLFLQPFLHMRLKQIQRYASLLEHGVVKRSHVELVPQFLLCLRAQFPYLHLPDLVR
jgi:hypothetical protein